MRVWMTLVLAAGVGLLASGCASSPATIRLHMDPWIGQSSSRLISAWGQPQGVFPLPDGGAIYSWLSQTEPTVTTTTNYYPAIHLANTTSSSESAFCRFDWTTDPRGTVTGYRWAGSCKITVQQ